MASNDYHFVTRWRVRGTVRQVADLLERPADFVRPLRPLFAANHRWAMRQGAEGLKRELVRR